MLYYFVQINFNKNDLNKWKGKNIVLKQLNNIITIFHIA